MEVKFFSANKIQNLKILQLVEILPQAMPIPPYFWQGFFSTGHILLILVRHNFHQTYFTLYSPDILLHILQTDNFASSGQQSFFSSRLIQAAAVLLQCCCNLCLPSGKNIENWEDLNFILFQLGFPVFSVPQKYFASVGNCRKM